MEHRHWAGNGLSYLSTHASPEYPGTGDPGDNYVKSGGALAKVPLPVSGIATEAFVAIWTQTLRTLVRTVRPGLLVVSAGYDFVAGDPIGDLGVAESAMRQIGRIIREIATEYCEGRALFVLEGGYDPATLATCVIETIRLRVRSHGGKLIDPVAVPDLLSFLAYGNFRAN